MVKNPPAHAGDLRDVSTVPGSGRSPGGGYDNPLQYSCLENAMDRGELRHDRSNLAQIQRLYLLFLTEIMLLHIYFKATGYFV